MWSFLTSLFLGQGGVLGRIFKSIDNSVDNETERQRIKGEVVGKFAGAQVAVLTGPGWWFPLFFIIPVGVWFASICLYSMLFCKGCIFPQTWTIAALPEPLDTWSGWIIQSLFVGGFAQGLMSKWKS